MTPWSTDNMSKLDAYTMYKRTLEIENYYFYYEDVLRVRRGYPDINFRHVVAPSRPMWNAGFVPIFATEEGIEFEK